MLQRIKVLYKLQSPWMQKRRGVRWIKIIKNKGNFRQGPECLYLEKYSQKEFYKT